MNTEIIESLSNPLVVARFWSKVDVRRSGECWPWQAKSRNEHGYGIFRPTKESGVVKAHRFAWALVNGPLSPEVKARHKCDNPPCCNPEHLLKGTQADNVADMHERGRRPYTSRVSAQMLRGIQLRARAGESQTYIAKDLGLSQSYISMLLRGERGITARKGKIDG